MRRNLRIGAALVGLAALTFWAATGANRGWSRTSEEIITVDEITGLEKREWKGTFVPGKDFLGATLMVAGILAGASFLCRKKNAGN
jgi:hypothetical protein